MAQNQSDNIQLNAPKDLDNRSGRFSAGRWRPYNDLAEFFSAQVELSRFETQGFWVRSTTDNNKADLYFLRKDLTPYKLISDIDLSNYYTKSATDTLVDLKVLTETERAIEQENILQSNISIEVAARINRDETIEGLVTTERNRAISAEESKVDKEDITETKSINYAMLDVSKSTFTDINYANATVVLVDTTVNTFLGQKTFNNSGVLDLGFVASVDFTGLLIGTIGDLKNYISRNLIFKNQTIGLTNFSAPYSTAATNGNIYLNKGQYSLIYGKAKFLNIITDSTGSFKLVHLRRFGDLYKNINSFVINTLFVADNIVQQIDLSTFDINVRPFDSFGIQLTSGTSGRVRTKSRTGESSYIAAPNLSTYFTIPSSDIISLGTPNNIGITFNLELEGDFILDTNERIDSVIDETGEPPLILNMGRMGIHSSYTNSTTQAFIIADSSAFQSEISGVFLYPSLVKEVSFITDFPTGMVEATVYLILMDKIEADKWEESLRVPLLVSEGLNTIDVSEMDIDGNVGSTLAIYSNTAGVNFSYKNVLTGYSFYSCGEINGKFTLTSPTFPLSPPVGNGIAMNFTAVLEVKDITERVSLLESKGDNSSLSERVSVLEQDVVELQSSINTTPYLGTLFHYGIDVDSNWVNNAWNLDSTGVTPTLTGLSNFLQLSSQYTADIRSWTTVINFSGSDTRFAWFTKPLDSNITKSSYFEANLSTGKINIYAAFSGGSSLPTTILQSVDYSFVTGRNYIVEISLNKYEFQNKIKITDSLSAESIEVIDESGNAGWQHDTYAMACISGSFPTIKSFKVASPYKTNLHCIIGGDSNTSADGNGVTELNGYAQKVAREIGLDECAILGRSGGNIDGILRSLISQVLYLKPKFFMLMIGTNAGNTEAKLQQVADFCQNNGIILLLNKIPMRSNQDVTARNVQIQNIRNANGLSGVDVDTATALNFNPADGIDPSKFFVETDGTRLHLNELGATATFKRTLIDTPQLYI